MPEQDPIEQRIAEIEALYRQHITLGDNTDALGVALVAERTPWLIARLRETRAALRKAEQERDAVKDRMTQFLEISDKYNAPTFSPDSHRGPQLYPEPLAERYLDTPERIEALIVQLKQERDEARRDCADLLEAAKAKLADCLECQDAALMEGEYCSNECGALAIAAAAMSAHKAAPDVLE